MKIVLVIVVLVFLLYYLFPLIQVVGYSMYPTYIDGEVLVGTKLYFKSRLKVGDVILYKCPTDTGRTVIKRIDSIRMDVFTGEPEFYCLGDNSMDSHDSRDYGYVDSKYLVCKVINQRRKQYAGY